MYQLRFWNVLKELKAQEIYLQLYACRDEGIDKSINIVLAIASSSSIASMGNMERITNNMGYSNCGGTSNISHKTIFTIQKQVESDIRTQ